MIINVTRWVLILQLLIMLMTRWGPGVFSYYHHWWIVPVIATHAGAVAGAWIYYLAIEVIVVVVFVVLGLGSTISPLRFCRVFN